ncbi:polysaccharide ABC transporter ATP-binding protein [Cerasicoccus maritimus]|uniref:ABC transporter ATP-binding protein n=1 Tax=Cerasicoccus maritimus TaxID=490089 RepID=UPI0028524C72|nr:polysaccharide ABC transporter ATP-binding protein [Cerasicoccus maritimus]
MSDTVVSIENLGKCYRLQHQGTGLNAAAYSRINEELARMVLNPLRKIVGKEPMGSHTTTEEFWALKNVSLEIKRGERLGLIGRNGAGKSTFLKLLSRIITPTTGRFSMEGKIASLLEVGTGFHPELTGRENIFLNGSVFGLKRYQIQEKYDEIVEFSGVERFLDTPVKRYSSGMQVRLAFSVAAHLDPEIMIIDEVLAVGDARFQKKCIGKMNEVANTANRTIIFVTHSMGFVEALCNRAILLEGGEMTADSEDVQMVVHNYLESTIDQTLVKAEWRNPGGQVENEFFDLLYMGMEGAATRFANNRPIRVQFEIDLKKTDPRLMLGIAIFNDENSLIAVSFCTDVDPELPSRMQPGLQTVVCEIPPHLLNERTHRLEFAARVHQGPNITEIGTCPASIKFEVAGGLSDSPYWTERRAGFCAPHLKWGVQ